MYAAVHIFWNQEQDMKFPKKAEIWAKTLPREMSCLNNFFRNLIDFEHSLEKACRIEEKLICEKVNKINYIKLKKINQVYLWSFKCIKWNKLFFVLHESSWGLFQDLPAINYQPLPTPKLQWAKPYVLPQWVVWMSNHYFSMVCQ